MQIVKLEHVDKGIAKYKGERDDHIERLMANGNLHAQVYRFKDGRYLVKFKVMDRAILYTDKEELLAAIQLD